MIRKFKESLLFVYATVADGGAKPKRDGEFNAYIFISFFCLVCLMYIYFVANRYVFDLNSILARCCSIGPDVNRNILSSKGIPVTLIVFPLSLYVSRCLCKIVKPYYPERIRKEKEDGYKHFLEKRVAFFIYFMVIAFSGPFSVEGSLVYSSVFFLLFIPSFLYIEYIVGAMASAIHRIRSASSGHK